MPPRSNSAASAHKPYGAVLTVTLILGGMGLTTPTLAQETPGTTTPDAPTSDAPTPNTAAPGATTPRRERVRPARVAPEAPRACRSVHLGYQAPAGNAFYNEVTVQTTAPGTYFCVCGWNTGYFGIQTLANGKTLAIFSVWDSKQDDPSAVPDAERVRVLHQGDGVRIGRFGGEGSGGQSFYDLDWQVGQTYRFLVTAAVEGERTVYAGYFFHPTKAAWKHMITFSTITGGKPLGGYYSFVEDFRRNGVSATQARQAKFGNTWVRTLEGDWKPTVQARFTADGSPNTNIDATTADDRFVLATGGETANTGVKLRELVTLPESAFTRPTDLPIDGS